MKHFLLLFIACVMLVSLSSCGKSEGGGAVTVEHMKISEASDAKEDQDDMDPYVGEYNAYDVDEPNLEIQKNDDGTYTIQIIMFRLAFLDDVVGRAGENGIEFTATAPNGQAAEGIITLEEDIATVTFTEGWNTFSEISEFKYHKTSDIPKLYVPDYK